MKHKQIRIIAVIIVSLLWPLPHHNPGINIYILNVGQGDSTLITNSLNYKILIDGGPNGVVAEQLDEILPFWDRKIDVIMLTHPDADHVSGLVDIMRRYEVDKVLLSPVKGDNSGYIALLKEINESKIQNAAFIEGQILTLTDGASITSLWPPGDSDWGDPDSVNELSQVVLFEYQEFSMLFTGDINTDIARELDIKGSLVDVDALKIPHHGSKYGFDARQLRKLSPLISTISVGSDNRFGHPAPSTIKLLKAEDSQIYRTDLQGRIRIEVNSSGMSVIPEEF